MTAIPASVMRPIPDAEAWTRLDDPTWTLEQLPDGRIWGCDDADVPTLAAWKRDPRDHARVNQAAA